MILKLSTGVTNGGVLSTIQFGMYLDELLRKLEQSGTECHVRNMFTCDLSYSDDVALLILKTCSEFLRNLDFIFNADKSKLIHFPCCSSKYETLKICFDGKALSNTSGESHFGNIIGSNIM